MTWFEKIKYYYNNGVWTKEQVRNVVGKVLTEEEYELIVGEPYTS